MRGPALASAEEYPFCAAVLDAAFMLFAALKLLPHPPAFCPALGTAISAPDVGERGDLIGFAALAAAVPAPEAVLVTALDATLRVMQGAWGALKADLDAGRGAPGAPPGAPSGDSSTAILHFKAVLVAGRAALLAALAERPPTLAALREGVAKAGAARPPPPA